MKKLKQIAQHQLDKISRRNYWDSFLDLTFDFDDRNQKFQTTEG